MKRCSWLLVASVMAALSSASCATFHTPQTPELKPPQKESSITGNGWWYVRFAMKWPKDAEPSWYMDPFLAHAVISPVLNKYGNEIVLWRFHRRAARDQAGHQFSFIFYSSPEAARRIYDGIQSNSLLISMKKAGLIIKDSYDDTSSIDKPNIEDTSDAKWPPAIQKSWPYYIMGVSEMWLDLVADLAERAPRGKNPDSPVAIQAFYKKVNESVTDLWQTEGDHAFLHHLNAIFGYGPLLIYERRPMTF